jgi:cation diffusion facilitator family transporter
MPSGQPEHQGKASEAGAHENPVAVYAAMGANLAIAVTKFVAAAITGSSAMISEGIHSLADTGNQLLLLLGINLSSRPADQQHPFGHGKDLYFWSLIVAVILFSVGGGMSIYEGISHIQHPSEISDPTWNYVVLGIAVIFESVAFTMALRELLRRQGRDESLWQAVQESKDPTIFVVLFEDTAALTGLVVAGVGVFLSHRLRMPVIDAIASIIIGIILAAVAVLLARESRGLLLGESADPEVIDSIRALAAENPHVERAAEVLTMHFGPNNVLVNLSVLFRPGISGSELAGVIDSLESAIKEHNPSVTHVYIDADALTQVEKKAPLKK